MSLTRKSYQIWLRRHADVTTRRAVGGVAWAIAISVLALTVVLAGCRSGPVRAFQGARHYSAGTDALALGEDERAVEELERAAVLVPHASEIRNHLGLAYWAIGDLISARSAFEAALELDCENDAARSNLEQLMAATGPSSPGREGNANGG